MTGCKDKNAYLDRTLDQKQQGLFEAHMLDCKECRSAIALWRGVENLSAKRDEFDEAHMRVQELALLKRASNLGSTSANKHSDKARSRFQVAFATMALAIAVAAFIFLFSISNDNNENKQTQTATIQASKAETTLVSTTQTPPKTSWRTNANQRRVFNLGDDLIGLDQASSVQQLSTDDAHTRLILKRGAVACDILHRTGGRTFSIKAKDLEVVVKGTKFSVSILDNAVVVAVLQGLVQVTSKDHSNTAVAAGHTLHIDNDNNFNLKPATTTQLKDIEEMLDYELDAHPKAVETQTLRRAPRLRSLGQIRAWIINGKYSDAQAEIKKHLKKTPDNLQAISLLADCLRKSGHNKEAVTQYKKLTRRGNKTLANRAGLMAAIILQDKLGRHKEAISLLKPLSIGPSPSAEVLVRLGKSYMALGQKEEAISRLKWVAAHHKGSIWGKRADRMLKKYHTNK